MQRCVMCGNTFREPEVHVRRQDMNGEGAYETFYEPYCPFCGWDDFEEVEEDEDNLDEV